LTSKIVFLLVILFFCNPVQIFAQAIFLNKSESAIGGKADLVLNNEVHGFHLYASVSPKGFLDLELAYGKRYSNNDAYSIQTIKPSIRFYPLLYLGGNIKFSFDLSFQINDYDFRDTEQFLFFSIEQKEKIFLLGGTISFPFVLNSKYILIPELGIHQSYIETKQTTPIFPEDTVLTFDFITQTENDQYLSLDPGVTIGINISSSKILYFGYRSEYYKKRYDNFLYIGLVFNSQTKKYK